MLAEVRQQIAEITEQLFLCGKSALNEESIKARGITCVINVTRNLDNVHFPRLRLNCVRIGIDDSVDADILQHLRFCVDKIEETRQNDGRTLVHCMMGMSRSASVCIAYLMQYKHMTLREAYYHVKSKRSIIRPNPAFWEQLIQFEYELYQQNSVEMMPFTAGWLPDVYKEDVATLMRRGWTNDLLGDIFLQLMLISIDIVSLLYDKLVKSWW